MIPNRFFVLIPAFAFVACANGSDTEFPSGPDAGNAADASMKDGASDGGVSDASLANDAISADVACSSTQKRCGASCVGLDDPAYGCGASSCSPCSLAHASARCDSTNRCAVDACNADWGDCDRSATNGCEQNLLTSDAYCGRCDLSCTAQDKCTNGSCGPRCVSPLTSCNSQCADLRSDALNCGQCGRSCGAAPVNGSVACVNSGCRTTCTGNLIACGSTCVAEDAAHCGSSCRNCPVPPLATATCTTGQCGFTCAAGTQLCANNTACCRTTPPVITGASSRESHVCARSAAGGAHCWGANDYGQLGDGTKVNRNRPIDVTGLSTGVLQVVAGGKHSCALMTGGTVKCWGWNIVGQLGSGTTATERLAPIDVVGLSGVVAINAGYHHTCAITTTGGLKCWGWNSDGQLGNGNRIDSPAPVDVTGLTSGVVSVGGGYGHTCAVLSTGRIKCWGYNSEGQLGNGTFGSTAGSNVPVDVNVITGGATLVRGGHLSTCALVSGGVKCWGSNTDGQLGDGSTTMRTSPVDVLGLPSTATQLDIVTFTACALASGSLSCWGRNLSGQVGNNAMSQSEPSPVATTAFPSGIATVVAGYQHTCVITQTGGMKCLGLNYSGELGDGTNVTPRLTSVDPLW